jgi:hypothetical protein
VSRHAESGFELMYAILRRHVNHGIPVETGDGQLFVTMAEQEENAAAALLWRSGSVRGLSIVGLAAPLEFSSLVSLVDVVGESGVIKGELVLYRKLQLREALRVARRMYPRREILTFQDTEVVDSIIGSLEEADLIGGDMFAEATAKLGSWSAADLAKLLPVFKLLFTFQAEYFTG